MPTPDGVHDAHVRMSLQLQQAFGMRREGSTSFQPSYAGRSDHIVLKSNWTKGGRECTDHHKRTMVRWCTS